MDDFSLGNKEKHSTKILYHYKFILSMIYTLTFVSFFPSLSSLSLFKRKKEEREEDTKYIATFVNGSRWGGSYFNERGEILLP